LHFPVFHEHVNLFYLIPFRGLFPREPWEDQNVIFTPNLDYYVEVKTMSGYWAGTNANVKIRLIGPKGATTPVVLDNPGEDDFEEGE